jgi:hypothetical protein
MKKYIYSQHHLGLVLAPKNSWWLKDTPEIKAYMEECKFLYDNPEKHTMPTHRLQAKEWEAYNTWLSSPPIYKVRPEDIEWFSVERGEDEFEVRKQWLREKANQWLDVDMHLPINYYCKTRLVAIPKKGNEPQPNQDAMKVLESLTPGGSEYYNNPEACAAFIKDHIEGLKRHIVKINRGNESKEQSPSVEQSEPIHEWFELSYAQYLTIPRSVLQSMPNEWQKRFTDCLNELDETIDWRPKEGRYWVKLKNGKGQYVQDPLMDYDRGRRKITHSPTL